MKNKTSRKYNCRSERITLTPWGKYATIVDIGGNEIIPISKWNQAKLNSFAWVFWGALLQISCFFTQSWTWLTSLKLAMPSARLIELYPIHAAICTQITLAGINETFVEWRLQNCCTAIMCGVLIYFGIGEVTTNTKCNNTSAILLFYWNSQNYSVKISYAIS